MNGAMDSVANFPPVTFFLAFVGPVLTLALVAFLWFGPRRLRMSAVLPGVPLALVSIVVQVLIGTFGILMAFQQIATQQRAGVRNVAGSMAATTGSFTTAISLSIGCVVALLIFQAIRERRDEQRDELTEPSERGNKLAPRIVFFLTAISALATMALLWFFERTLDVIMLICDNSRKGEAQERLGSIPTGEIAGAISRRLVLCELFSLALLALLLTAPFWLLAGEGPEWVREKSLTLAVVIALCLVPFAFAYHQEFVYMISLAQPK
jgi:hypothetical protein